MAEHTLRIVHFSDLHERVELPWMDDKRKAKIRLGAPKRYRGLGEGLTEALQGIAAERPVTLVCFTGDVADWGLPEEYAKATERLHPLLEAVGVPWSRFFPIPGNHDVQRLVSAEPWADMRKLAQHDPAGLSQWMAGADRPYRAKHGLRGKVRDRTKAFRTWLTTEVGQDRLNPKANPHGRLGYRAPLDDLGLPFPVHIIGLDSAWLCGDENDSGKALLTDGQVDLLATEDGRPLTGFRLALVHHPLTFLADGPRCRQLLADEVDLLLHGHQHEPIAEEDIDPDRALRLLAAGSLYEGDAGDRWVNSFHVIDILLDGKGRPLRYDLEFWGWSERGHWYRTGAIYQAAETGHLTQWTPAGKEWQATQAARGGPLRLQPGHPAERVFVGREKELDSLKAALIDAPADRPVAVTAVEGMPGVGKSYLAARFAQLHAGDFPGGARQLVLEPQNPGTADDLRDQACSLLQLPEQAGASGWDILAERLRTPLSLLVLENVDTPGAAAVAADFAAHLRGCRLLMTGRVRDLGADAGWTPVPVQPFTEDEALRQLSEEWREPRDPAEDEEFRRLVRELGFLPQAIHLAAGHLRRRGETPDHFLCRLHESGLELAPADPADPRLHSPDRARAILSHSFSLSLQALRTHFADRGDRLAAGFCALGHGPLSGWTRSLGAAISGLDQPDLDDLAIEACGLSIMEYEEPTAGSPGRFRLHPLIAEFLRAQCEEGPSLDRMTDWFVERLPEGADWNAIHAEGAALTDWLRRVPDADLRRVERAATVFARVCGPFRAWADLCERGLGLTTDPAERSDYLWTLANARLSAGDVTAAEEAAQAKLALDRGRGADREAALAAGVLANILSARGDLDDALRIRREEELPVYDRLGAVRDRAITVGQIADILYRRGDLDEALRIRREEQLPVYERLGDVRERAVTMGSIADILYARRDLDEALRIRREEELPVYERLGDVHARAVTMGKIADILFDRGDPDEALRIRREDQLPVYERLGDVRERAVTMGQIADILDARGDLDEALRIRREEELPVYERLGDVRSRAVTMGRIAGILYDRGDLDEALRIRREEELPVFERLGDVRSRAVTMGKIADILSARGDLDEALRIRREEQLPVFERLGDVRELLVGRANLALDLLDRGHPEDREEARQLLNLALEAARRLRIPEASRIEDILKQQGWL